MLTLSEQEGNVLRDWHDLIMTALLEYKGRYKNMSIEDLHDYLNLIDDLSSEDWKKALGAYVELDSRSDRIPRSVLRIVVRIDKALNS